MAKRSNGSQGPSPESDDHLLTQARLVRKVGDVWTPPYRNWPVVHSALIKPPKYAGDSWLLVVKATTEDGERVYFHKARTLMAVVAFGLHRVFTGRADWKVETPWRPPRG